MPSNTFPPASDPAARVQTYLAAMEAREIETAQSFLDPGFAMVFPGTAPMHSLQELIDWAKLRYRFVRKTYDRFDTMSGTNGADVVYCTGTLSGEWPDGSTFDGIRFIDRFELSDGQITRQDVWNDIAEVKAQ